MSRLLSTARCDLELQARNGLYYATGFVLLLTLAALGALPASGLARLLPAVALNTMGVTGFYFSAALTLLERAEGRSRTTEHSARRTQHSALNTQHSALSTSSQCGRSGAGPGRRLRRSNKGR